jgi:hypothetical protein
MKNLLNREKLLAKEELEVVQVDLGKDEFVYVRQMTGHERDRFEQSLRREIKNKAGIVDGFEMALNDFRAKLAVVTLCNEKGELLLEPTDYPVLSKSMSAARLEKIVNEAQRLNAITEEDKEALVKNSEAVQDGSSNSGFAENLR